jgi:hypothetical protein
MFADNDIPRGSASAFVSVCVVQIEVIIGAIHGYGAYHGVPIWELFLLVFDSWVASSI